MSILIDTDILIDVALDRKPFSEAACQLIDALQTRPRFGHVAWHSLSNLFYLVSPKLGGKSSRQFIMDLLGFIEVAATSTQDAMQALTLKMNDFEDAMQVAAALACKAEVIVTRNLKHYKNSPISAMDANRAIRMIS